jgi:hypothetical protein
MPALCRRSVFEKYFADRSPEVFSRFRPRIQPAINGALYFTFVPLSMNPSLVIGAAFIVAVLGAGGALNSYQVSARYAEQLPDAYGGEHAQTRFAPLVERVPASAELAYFTDLEPGQAAYDSAFLGAQYAVAPRVLVLLHGQPPPEWAVGNFSKPSDFSAAGDAKGYAMIADLGQGVILFRRKL